MKRESDVHTSSKINGLKVNDDMQMLSKIDQWNAK